MCWDSFGGSIELVPDGLHPANATSPPTSNTTINVVMHVKSLQWIQYNVNISFRNFSTGDTYSPPITHQTKDFQSTTPQKAMVEIYIAVSDPKTLWVLVLQKSPQVHVYSEFFVWNCGCLSTGSETLDEFGNLTFFSWGIHPHIS